MKNLTKNWKTTLVGIAALAATATEHFAPQYSGTVTTIIGLLTGLGFIAAKDGNKTGL